MTELAARGVILDEAGLTFSGDALTVEEWYELGRVLTYYRRKMDWALADFLAYGEARYGEKYYSICDLLDVGYGTLRNMAYTARRWPKDKRNLKLTFSHHRILASLPEAERFAWIQRAADEKMTIAALRVAMLRERSARLMGECAGDLGPVGFDMWFGAMSEREGWDVGTREKLERHLHAAFLAGRRYEAERLRSMISEAAVKKYVAGTAMDDYERETKKIEGEYLSLLAGSKKNS